MTWPSNTPDAPEPDTEIRAAWRRRFADSDRAAGGALEQLTAASVRYRIAVGPQAGRRTLTLRTSDAESPQSPHDRRSWGL